MNPRTPGGWKNPGPELEELVKKFILESHDKVLADPEITGMFNIGHILAALVDIQATNRTIDQALQDPDKDLQYLKQTRAALKIIMSYDQTRLDVVNERIRMMLQAQEPTRGAQEAPGAKIPEPPGQEDQEPEKR